MEIKELKRQRNNIYKKLKAVDNKIDKAQEVQSEKEKEKYVGKYFEKAGYGKFPSYLKVLKYSKKGFEYITVDVDDGEVWLSRYETPVMDVDLKRISKKIFEEKLNKGLKKLK